MSKAIRTYSRDVLFLTLIGILAALVAGYILSNQRLTLPKWVPLVGSDYVNYKVELPTAQSLTPGQGQTVNVAGVSVGEITRVDLEDGRALVTVKIKRKYTPIYKDATILVRPKTGLNDMIFELSPGSRSKGALADDGKGRIPVSQTLPNVNLDEILASLDADTRDYLTLLVGGAAEGLKGRSGDLAATLKRLAPTNRDIEKIAGLLAERRGNLRRTIHNFSALSTALGGKDRQLAQLVRSSNAVFTAFANQDARLRETLRELPPTLQATQSGLTKANTFAQVGGRALSALRPGARALGPSLRQTRPFLRQTTPIIRDRLRPFSRDALPTIRSLRPAAADLAGVTPNLTESLRVVNTLLNTLAYDKPGDGNESYLFWLAWANHLGNTVFATQDAQGPIRRGLLTISCSGLETLDQLAQVNDQLGLIIRLLDPPRNSAVCPKTSQAGTGTQPAASRGGLSPLSPDAPKPIATETAK